MRSATTHVRAADVERREDRPPSRRTGCCPGGRSAPRICRSAGHGAAPGPAESTNRRTARSGRSDSRSETPRAPARPPASSALARPRHQPRHRVAPSARTRPPSSGSASPPPGCSSCCASCPTATSCTGPTARGAGTWPSGSSPNNGAFTALMWSDGTLWFEIVYALAVLGQRPAAARLAHPHHVRALHGRRALAAEPQHLHGRRRRQRHPPDGDLPGAYPLRPGLVAGRARAAARGRMRARAADRGRTAARTVVGPVLWVGARARAAPRRPSWAGSAAPAGCRSCCGAVAGARPVVGRGPRARPAGEPRTLLDVVANLVHNARPARDHGRGLSDLRDGRLVQDPGLALAGRHRRLLPAPPGLLLPVARALRPARVQRH